MKVLVIEDDEDIADAIEQLILDLGHDVNVARRAAAVDALPPSAEADVVLVDLVLPDAHGLDLPTRLRARFSAALLVAMSASIGADLQQRVRDAGFDAFLAKPFEVADVQRILRETEAA